MTQTVLNNTDYLTRFNDFLTSQNGNLSSPLLNIRREGIENFSRLGFPTRKNEAWKYTNISSISNTLFDPLIEKPKSDFSLDFLRQYLMPEASGRTLLFVNGIFSPEFSDVSNATNLTVANLADKKSSTAYLDKIGTLTENSPEAFISLNTAFFRDGALISIPDNTVINEPVQFIFITNSSAAPISVHPRNIISIGSSSTLNLIETHISLDSSNVLHNSVTEIFVGPNSSLNHIKLHHEGDSALHIANTVINQERDSKYSSFFVTFGGKIVRNEITSNLNGENSECILNGLYLTRNSQHVDNHTKVNHNVPHCKSRQVYRGILDGQSSAVFDGGIEVKRHAQKTDAVQSNKNLLLSDKALINSKPTLLIFADDVKCTHGATVGQLDKDQLFYLRSRGIDEESARTLLTYAFASDLIDSLDISSLKTKLEELILSWLPHDSGNVDSAEVIK